MQSRRVLLLGIDGADWNLIHPLLDAGELPVLQDLVNGGTIGNLATLQPTLSPILWNAIATGKRAGKHGIHGFTEVDADTGTVRPVSSLSRSCKALWHILQQNGLNVHVVNWFASHPAEPLNGIAVSDFFPNVANPDPDAPWPLPPDCIHPADRREDYQDLRVHPEEVDADVGALFIQDLDDINRHKDAKPTQLAMELARTFSVQTAALNILANEPWDFTAVYYRFTDILGHLFMAYHPPQMEGVPDADFHHYHDAVNSSYRLLNLMLRNLLAAAGPDTTVILVSDHGFHHAHLRPKPNLASPFDNPEGWHRDQGVFVARGPGIRSDELVHGAGLLDITPTILALFGLPVGRDMDGRALNAIFEETPEIVFVDSWDDVEGDCGRHPPGTRMGEADAKALLDQFVALGYIDPLDANKEQAARQTRLNNQWNLARDYLDCADWEQALPLLEALHDAWPGRPECALQLAFCQWRLGLLPEASRTAGDVARMVKEGPQLSVLLGHLAGEDGRIEEAIAHYEAAAGVVQDTRLLHLSIGRAWLRSQKRILCNQKST